MVMNNDNIIGFRTPTLKEKERIKKEAEELDSSIYELVTLGIEAKKSLPSEKGLLAKKNLEIEKRNKYLKEAHDSNLRIEAYNRQLRDRFKRHKKITPVEDNVIDNELFKPFEEYIK